MNDNEDKIEGLDRLARSVRPRRDLWPGIQARLAPRARRSRWAIGYSGMQMAVAASVVAGLGGLFSLQMARAPRPATATTQSVAYAGFGTLEPHSRAIVKANLKIVTSAEQQLRQALVTDPDSAALRNLLASTENRGRALRALL